MTWSRSLIAIRIKLGFLDQAEQSSEDLAAIGDDDDDDQQKEAAVSRGLVLSLAALVTKEVVLL